LGIQQNMKRNNTNPAAALAEVRWAKTPKDKACVICGAPSRRLYCTPEHSNIARQRRKYEKVKAAKSKT